MSRIFVSYNRQSQDMARTLVGDLEDMGHDVWFDHELSGGQAWWGRILAEIRDSDVFVFLLDAESLNSAACRREFGYASVLGKPVLPVLVAEGISTSLLPPELSLIQFVDYRKQDRKSGLALARALGSVPRAKPLPDPLPSPPAAPVSYLGDLSSRIEAASLSSEEQKSLVFDLRRGLRDLKAANDTRTLLVKLRSRRDLFAATAEEIDELLGSRSPSAPAPPEIPRPQPRAGVPQRGSTTLKISPDKRRLGAFIGIVAGATLGAAVLTGNTRAGDKLFAAVIAGVAGAIAGAVTGMHVRVTLIALAGFFLGFGVWALADSGEFRFVRAVILGGGAGSVLGASIGAVLRARQRWP